MLGCEGAYVCFALPHVHGDDPGAFLSARRGGNLEMHEVIDARRAPGGPEVQDQRLAGFGSHRHRVIGWPHQREGIVSPRRQGQQRQRDRPRVDQKP
jgi:hypothetical protein